MKIHLSIPWRIFVSIVLALGWVAAPGHSARAATWTVNSLGGGWDGSCDSINCTLQDAVSASASGDTINFDASLSGPINLDNPIQLDGKTLIINGTPNVQVSGQNTVQVIILVNDADLTVDGLTIQNGHDPENSNGGAVYVLQSTLTLTKSTIQDSSAPVHGGAIYSEIGTVHVTDSLLQNNSAQKGGAIYNIHGTVTVTGSTFIDNTATNYGGAIYNTFSSLVTDGILNVADSTFTSNSTTGAISGGGGGIENIATLTLTNSTFDSNHAFWGGGVENDGVATITGSTFKSNTAQEYGGGMQSNGTATVANSTFWGNTAVDFGGGIDNNSPLTLTNSTLVGNSAAPGKGGGIDTYEVMDFANNIIANNTGGDCYAYESSYIGTNTNNLVLDGTCSDGGVNFISGENPKLGPLQDNGGPTWTMALQIGSPAIDAGDEPTCMAAPVSDKDQRGVQRSLYGSCDIGAFEFSAFCFVNAAATGINDGSSWANAYTNLQSALNQPSCLEIWVAEGTYKPASGTNRSATFILPSGVAVYGGFAGTETDRSQRLPTKFITYLSGDIDNNDSQTPVITNLGTVTGNTTNSYHVVSKASGATGAILDGMTITAGYADGVSPDHTGGGITNAGTLALTNVHLLGNYASTGGGIYNAGTLTIYYSSFVGNKADTYGGGMLNHGGTVSMSNITLQNNVAQANFTSGPVGGGGAIHNDNSGTLTVAYSLFVTNSSMGNGAGGAISVSTGTATVTDSTFYDNHAEMTGGAIYNGYTVTITDSTLYNNSAVYSGGGIDNFRYLYLTNSTLNNNSARRGGGISDVYGNTIQLINNTISGNTAENTGYGGNLNLNHTAHLDYANNIIANSAAAGGDCVFNTVTVARNLNNLDGDHTCSATFTGDPKLTGLVNYGGPTSIMALLSGSPAIDAGNDATCAAAPVSNLDQRGMLRPQGLHCDIGAYEAQLVNLPLVTGWNLVSIRLHPLDTAVASVLSSLGDQYSLVYAWDAAGSQWRIHDPSLGSLNDLTDLDEKLGFWVKMKSSQTLTVSASVVGSRNIDLLTGWNLVGYPSALNASLPDVLGNHGLGSDFSLVYAYHAGDASAWKLFDRLGNPLLNDLTELSPGWGYWIKASAAHTWSVP